MNNNDFEFSALLLRLLQHKTPIKCSQLLFIFLFFSNMNGIVTAEITVKLHKICVQSNVHHTIYSYLFSFFLNMNTAIVTVK